MTRSACMFIRRITARCENSIIWDESVTGFSRSTSSIAPARLVDFTRNYLPSISLVLMFLKRPSVHGVSVDPQTRCVHYSKPLDVIAIKMKCCGVYYACKDCHAALEEHAAAVWPRNEWHQKAVLCGVCGLEMSVDDYMHCNHHCPSCNADFNPGCARHYQFYFEINPGSL